VDSSSKWLLDGKLETSSGGAYFNMNFTMNFVLDNMVTMGEVTLGGMCDKFPSLNIYFIESGHSWAGETLYRLDKVFDCPFEEYMPNGLPNAKTRPSEIFQRQMYVPYEGGDQWMAPIFNKMQDNLIWASDIPHWDADGPWEGAGALRALGVSPEIERKIMGGNAAKLLNVPYEKKVRTKAAA
jgi:predicted TIM-barrel fold metal-dependent hydrolase